MIDFTVGDWRYYANVSLVREGARLYIEFRFEYSKSYTKTMVFRTLKLEGSFASSTKALKTAVARLGMPPRARPIMLVALEAEEKRLREKESQGTLPYKTPAPPPLPRPAARRQPSGRAAAP